MLKTLKFNTKDQEVWFSSDLHWNHDPKWDNPIWKMRGFTSLDESNKYSIDKINELVKKDDLFFHAGDLTLNTSEEQFEKFIDSINCKNIWCLWGNHPNPMAKIYKREIENIFEHFETSRGESLPKERDILEIYPFRYKNLIFAGDYLELIVNNQFICINHYPISVHNNCNSSSWALVGHSHHGFGGSKPNNKKGKILDIGWDGFKSPLSFYDVKAIMDGKEVASFDNHH